MTFGSRLSGLSPRTMLFIGLAIRETLCPWTGHYDMEIWIRNAYYVAHGVNPYTYMGPAPGLSFAYITQQLPSIGYLPLWSYLVAGIYRLYAILPPTTPFVFYFLIKQPIVLGDIVLGFLLFKATLRWGSSPEGARTTMRFWMFFPYAIIISAIWGQFDALVASLILWSLLIADPIRRSFVEGAGILLKVFPVLFIPYRVFATRGISRWTAGIALAIPALFTYATFLAFGWDFLGFNQMLVFSVHGNPGGITYARVLVPLLASASPTSTLLFAVGTIWVVAVIIAGFFASRKFPTDTPEGGIQALLLITSVFFLTRWGVNEQYLVYLIPLLLVDVSLWHPERRSLFRVTCVLGVLYVLLNNLLLIRFIAPVYPGVIDLDYVLDNLSPIAFPRGVLLDALGILFSVHLIQLALVVVRKSSPAPWMIRALRAGWSSLGRAIKGVGNSP